MRIKNKQGFILPIVLAVLVIAAVVGVGILYVQNKKIQTAQDLQNSAATNDNQSSASSGTTNNQQPPQKIAPLTPEQIPSTTSTQTFSLPFLLASSTKDIRIDLQYQKPSDTTGFGDAIVDSTGIYIDPSTKDQYFLLLNKINQSSYGGYNYDLFKGEESHSYQGTPVSLSTIHNNQSLSYIGFKINDPSLVAGMNVELGIDYQAGPVPKPLSFLGTIFSELGSWLSTKIAEACGPGIYLRPVGSSPMTYVSTSNGISWFKLDKEISVSDLVVNYCTGASCDDGNIGLKDLSNGNLRMHVSYAPAGVTGTLKIQLSNAVFHNQQDGTYVQASIGSGSADIYRAILSKDEFGSLSFEKDLSNPNVVNLALANVGHDPIIIDDYSFNRIKNNYVGKQAVGIVVKDSNNQAIAHLPFSKILNKTMGKTIQPNGALDVQVINASSLRDDLYTISVEYADSNIQAPIAPRLIDWNFKDTYYRYSLDKPMYMFVVAGRAITNLGIFPLAHQLLSLWSEQGSSNKFYHLGYLFPLAGKYPLFDSALNLVSQYEIKKTTVAEIKNNTGILYSYFIPNSLGDYLNQLGVQPNQTLIDSEGNKISVYLRGDITGYAVERDMPDNNSSSSVHGTIVYEIPTTYLNDPIFKQIYEFSIKSGSFRKEN